jgi:hypothetical protein
MAQLYPLREIQQLTGLDRQTLDRYVRYFRIAWDGADRPRSRATRTRKINEKGVSQLKLIAALKKDVRFEDSEIESILRRISVEEFLNLFVSMPFPKLIDELRRRRIAIDDTSFMARLLDLQATKSTLSGDSDGTGSPSADEIKSA